VSGGGSRRRAEGETKGVNCCDLGRLSLYHRPIGDRSEHLTPPIRALKDRQAL
jgi:hypothetical protein